MAKNYFKSYIWLLETLQSRGPLTLKDIQRLWLRSSVNDEGKKLAPRTFSNHIQAIEDVLGVEIRCDRRDNTYSIRNEEDIRGGKMRDRMLGILTLKNLLNESASLMDRILFEDVPSREKWLPTVIQAMRDEMVLNVVYKSYKQTEPQEHTLEPYFLREHKRRWYLYAHESDKTELKMFALDRIESMKIGEEKFTLQEDFNAKELFAVCYGPRIYPNTKPEIIVLKADANQAKYFKSLPLHTSQEVIEESDRYTLFRYFLIPDYDFKQDVLSFGAAVEVLEPEHLRKELAETIKALNAKYNGADL